MSMNINYSNLKDFFSYYQNFFLKFRWLITTSPWHFWLDLLFFLLLFFSCLVMSDSFATLWIVAHQTPLSMGFPRQDTGVGCHFLLQGIFLTQGSNPCLLCCRQVLYHWTTRDLNDLKRLFTTGQGISDLLYKGHWVDLIYFQMLLLRTLLFKNIFNILLIKIVPTVT